MAAKTYKLIHLAKHLPVKDVDKIKELLEELGWTDEQGKGPLASVSEETLKALQVKLSPGGAPRPEAKQENAKVQVQPEPAKPSRARMGIRAKAALSSDIAAPPAPTEKKTREVQPIKTFFDADDLAGKRKQKAAKETAPAAEKPETATAVQVAEPPKPPAEKTETAEEAAARKAKKPKDGVPKAPAKAAELTEEEKAALKKTGGKVETARKFPEKRPPVKKKIKEIGKAPDEAVPTRGARKIRVFAVKGARGASMPAAKTVHVLKVSGDMTVRDVSLGSGIKVSEIISFLLKELDTFATINHLLSIDEIQLLAEHFNVKCEVRPEEAPEDILEEYTKIQTENLQPRPPVVTVMGHVDHGKTKLLDRIRNTNVVAGEAGGITQHIGAYQVIHNGRTITFIDTPGHAAFTQMRARGSQVTDIVILVVAADDGVKPQTKEAIEHARAAKVPIIVALNKCDLASANPERSMSQVSELGLVPEEWGGDTVYVKISALQGDGIEELLEMVLLQADLLEYKADPTAPPYGIVVESEITKGQGVIATVLVMQGTLKRGQHLVCGTSGGRIKRMEDEWGKELDDALPARPVRIIGFVDVPSNGDKVFAFQNKRKASEIIEVRKERAKLDLQQSHLAKPSLEDFFSRLEKGELKDLNVIVKTDVGGSEEAIVTELQKIAVEDVKVNVISHGVGQINENDVMLASASDAIILGFSTSLTSGAKRLAEREKVDVRIYNIIYQMMDEIKKAMLGLLEPVFQESELARVEVREIFRTEKSSVICGGFVLDGKAERGKKYRLMRNGEVVHEHTLRSLRRFKEDVREVASGYECGFVIEGTGDVQLGDILAIYEMKEVPRT